RGSGVNWLALRQAAQDAHTSDAQAEKSTTVTKNEEDMTISVGSPRFEHLAYALGIGVAQPRISWQIVAPASWRQEAYELSFARAGGAWQSVAPVVSEQQILVPWPTAPLSS